MGGAPFESLIPETPARMHPAWRWTTIRRTAWFARVAAEAAGMKTARGMVDSFIPRVDEARGWPLRVGQVKNRLDALGAGEKGFLLFWFDGLEFLRHIHGEAKVFLITR